MKLRNKKTGGIDDFNIEATGLEWTGYTSLREFCEDWGDVEEPKEFLAISPYRKEGYEVFPYDNFVHIYRLAEELGIAFETKEEAEQAVEKLKALKRLKDNGFKFEGWKRDEHYCGDFTITATDQTSCDDKDLDLLFGGRE